MTYEGRERRPVEPFGGSRERKVVERRRARVEQQQQQQDPDHVPAWQQQHQRVQRPQRPRDDGFEYEGDRQHQEFEETPRRRVYEDDSGFQGMGWVIGLLVFGVGNYFLYKYTGWLIIPIPRR